MEELSKLTELEKKLNELRRKYSRGNGKYELERELIRVIEQQIAGVKSRLFETRGELNDITFNITELTELLVQKEGL